MRVVVMDILIFISGCILGFILAFKLIYVKNTEMRRNAERTNIYLSMMNQWLILKEMGIRVDVFLKNMKAQRVVIYGMGVYGRHLIREIEKTDVEIVYAIDQKKMMPFHNVSIVSLSEHLPPADLIINTVLGIGEEISVKLQQYYKCPIVDLNTIIFESYSSKRNEAIDR